MSILPHERMPSMKTQPILLGTKEHGDYRYDPSMTPQTLSPVIALDRVRSTERRRNLRPILIIAIRSHRDTSMNLRPNHVPAWYRLEEALILNPLTRPLLFTWHRIRKKLGMIREKQLARKQPQCLRNFEQQTSSQNGEEGIVQEIFNRIGTTDKFFVEFGIQDGSECNTRNLLEKHGWSGVWMEGSPELADRARQNFSRFSIKVLHRFLTTENLVASFEEAGVPKEFDLLSIDVDGNDYWMWSSLGRGYSPRVVVIEYNATFGPRNAWVMPYDSQFRHDATAYFGASLEAMAALGRDFGYRLVRCESQGVNAFFVRSDLAATKFPGSDRSTSFHYVVPHYADWFGYPVRKIT
jgi:hypothetical protein